MTAAMVLEHPAVTRQRLRQRLTLAINKLIRALDEIDGDPDLETDGCDEPSLAFQEARLWESQDAIIRWSPIGGDQFTDLEEACEDEGASDGDMEPSLCGVGMPPNGGCGVYHGGTMHHDLEGGE